MLTFKLTVKGVQAMEYQLIDKEAFHVTGFGLKIEQDMEVAQSVFRNFGMKSVPAEICKGALPLMDQETPGVLGVSLMTSEVQDAWEYVIGVVNEEATEEFAQ